MAPGRGKSRKSLNDNCPERQTPLCLCLVSAKREQGLLGKASTPANVWLLFKPWTSVINKKKKKLYLAAPFKDCALCKQQSLLFQSKSRKSSAVCDIHFFGEKNERIKGTQVRTEQFRNRNWKRSREETKTWYTRKTLSFSSVETLPKYVEILCWNLCFENKAEEEDEGLRLSLFHCGIIMMIKSLLQSYAKQWYAHSWGDSQSAGCSGSLFTLSHFLR